MITTAVLEFETSTCSGPFFYGAQNRGFHNRSGVVAGCGGYTTALQSWSATIVGLSMAEGFKYVP